MCQQEKGRGAGKRFQFLCVCGGTCVNGWDRLLLKHVELNEWVAAVQGKRRRQLRVHHKQTRERDEHTLVSTNVSHHATEAILKRTNVFTRGSCNDEPENSSAQSYQN